MRKYEQMATAFGLALLTLTTVSCAKGKGDPPAGDETGSVTTTAKPTSGNTAPVASSAPTTTAKVVPVPNGTAPATTPTTVVETPAALPSPAVLQAVSAVQGKLDGVAAGVTGTHVRFVDCQENASCTARLEAPTLAALRDLLQAVNNDQGGIDFTAREQLDAFTGRSFVADVTLGAANPRAVPTAPSELLGVTP